MPDSKQRMVEAVPGVDEELAEVVEAVHEGIPLREVFGFSQGQVQSVLETAHALYERGRLEDARDLTRGARSLDEELFYPHLLLGDIYRKQDELEESLESFEKALEIDGEAWEVQLRAARVESELGRVSDARNRLERVVDAEDLDEGLREEAESLLEMVAD